MTEPTDMSLKPTFPPPMHSGNTSESAEKSPFLSHGDVCPICDQGILDWDGLLNLSCPACGFSLGGGCYT